MPTPRSPRLSWSSRPAASAKAVAIIVDGNAYPFAAVLAVELHRLEPQRNYDIVVLLTDDTRPEPSLLPEARLGGLDDAGVFDGLPVTRRIPLTAYARLLLPAALPEYEAILYLDADILPLRSGVDSIFMQPPPAIMSAAPERSAWVAANMPDKSEILRNSGVILIDAAQARAERTGERIIDFAHANKGLLRFHDQSALNLALKGELGLLSLRWNWPDLADTPAERERFQPTLLHFIAHPKPWDWTPGHHRMEFFDLYSDILRERFGVHIERKAETASWTLVNRAHRIHRSRWRERISVWLERQTRLQKTWTGKLPPKTLPGSAVPGRLEALEALADL